MRLSLVMAVLDSHEVVRRQMLYLGSLGLPDDVEVVLVDDGSNPPLEPQTDKFKLSVYQTGETRHWTQPAARNLGAKMARGEYLILTDIDHIVSRELIEIGRNCQHDVVRFSREVAVIDEEGRFTQDWDALRAYGFIKGRKKIAPHGNSYLMRADLYRRLGGVDTSYVGTGKYPNREEVPLKRKLHELEARGEITIWNDEHKPTIYMIPNGKYCGHADYNPFGLFHTLSRKRNIGRLTNKERRRARSVRHNSGA